VKKVYKYLAKQKYSQTQLQHHTRDWRNYFIINEHHINKQRDSIRYQEEIHMIVLKNIKVHFECILDITVTNNSFIDVHTLLEH
jgi:hypothetical protein